MKYHKNINFQPFIQLLSKCLKVQLPGEIAHQLMGSTDDYDEKKTHTAHKSGVLLLFYPKNNKPHFVLIKRTQHLQHHSGQICLPGGKMDNCDINIQQTALREAEEEIGVKISDITVVGSLSPVYIEVSNFIVYPSVAFINNIPIFEPNVKEVEKIIEVGLYNIFTPQNKQTINKQFKGESITVPIYNINHNIVWGATAKILKELEYVLRQHTKF